MSIECVSKNQIYYNVRIQKNPDPFFSFFFFLFFFFYFKTANEIKPFDLTRRLRIDPTRLDPIRATNLLRFPERSVARPLTSHDAIRTKLLFAESVHEDVVQRRSKQPGGPDLYRDQRYLSTQVKAKRCEEHCSW